MLTQLWSATKRFLGHIPIIKKIVTDTTVKNEQSLSKARAELNSFHSLDSRLKTVESSVKHFIHSGDKLTNLGVTAIKAEVLERAHQDVRDFNHRSILTEIESHIYKMPNNSVELQEAAISNAVLLSANALRENFEQSIGTLIADINAGKSEDLEKKKNLFNNVIVTYLRSLFELIDFSNTQILRRTLSLDSIRDIDVIESLKVNRDISRLVAQHAFGSLKETMKQIGNIANRGKELRSSVAEALKLQIRSLFLVSNFGMHSQSVVNNFKQALSMQLDNNEYSQLDTLRNLEQAVKASILYEGNGFVDHQASIDQDLYKKKFRELIYLQRELFKLKYDDIDNREQEHELNRIKLGIDNLRNFLSELAFSELASVAHLKESSGKQNWLDLGLNPKEEFAYYSSIFAQMNFLSSHLGKISEEKILNNEIKSYDLVRLNSQEAYEQLQRVLNETTLLALLEVRSRCRGLPNISEERFTSHSNFQKLPWLKDFYKEEKKRYENSIEDKSTTELPTRNLSRELPKLGTDLYNLRLFSTDDFFKRYNIEDIGESLLKVSSTLTDVGILNLTIEIFHKFFTFISPGDITGLTNTEIDRIHQLASSLQKECTVHDINGQAVDAPRQPTGGGFDPLAEAAYHKMERIVGDTGFLVNHGPLVIKFLRSSLGLADNDPIGKAKGGELNKNMAFSALLFYIMIKFLPQTSNDIDSLKMRMEFLKTSLPLYQEGQDILTVFHDKISQQVVGLRSDLKSPRVDGKVGIVKAIAKDLDNIFANYRQIHNDYRKSQQGIVVHNPKMSPNLGANLTELLNLYAELEEQFKKHPQGIKDIERFRLAFDKEPLMKGLKSAIDSVLDIQTELVVNFVKSKKDPDLELYTRNLLLNRAAKLAKELTNSQREFVLLDNSKDLLYKFLKLLSYLENLGQLVNSFGINKIILNPNMFTQSDSPPSKNILDDLQIIENLQAKPLVLKNAVKYKRDEEAYTHQYLIKRIVVEQLKRNTFGFTPRYSAQFKWMSEEEINKIKNDQSNLYADSYQYSKSNNGASAGTRAVAA